MLACGRLSPRTVKVAPLVAKSPSQAGTKGNWLSSIVIIFLVNLLKV
jgi:hypothetical protein